MNDMIEKERFSPGVQLAILLISFGACYFMAGLIILAVAAVYLHVPLENLEKLPKLIEDNIVLNRVLQVVGTFMMFGLPAFIFAYINNKTNPFGLLGFNRAVNSKQVFYTLIIVIAGLWVSEAFGLINEWIPIPKRNEIYFRQLEDEYTKATVSLLSLKTIGGLLVSLFVIALMPAILEELLFRGCLQKVLYSLSKHTFLSIFLTSLLFSYSHASYYGFLPRFFLGMGLGYMYHYSKNIWLNILFHLVNNGIVITMMFIMVQNGKTMQYALENSGVTNNMPVAVVLVVGAILTALIVFVLKLFKRESTRVLAAHAAANPQLNDDTTGTDTINVL